MQISTVALLAARYTKQQDMLLLHSGCYVLEQEAWRAGAYDDSVCSPFDWCFVHGNCEKGMIQLIPSPYKQTYHPLLDI